MKVLAFDANSIVNRAFYGVRLLSTREGTYTNAVYGFFNIVYKLIEEQKPDAVAFAFDLHAPTFRHKMYEQYKGTRKGMPEELRQQMPLVKEMLRRLGYPIQPGPAGGAERRYRAALHRRPGLSPAHHR